MFRTGILLFCIASYLLPARSLVAGVISSRSNLDTLLGTTAVTEDFEKYQVGNTNVSAFIKGGGTTLDSTSIFGGNFAGQGSFVRGPGLIEEGISFDWGVQDLQWNVSSGSVDRSTFPYAFLMLENPLVSQGFFFAYASTLLCSKLVFAD